MFEQEAIASTDAAPGEEQPDVIAQWKTTVQQFFSHEWENLRNLMRRLEESDWDGVALEPPTESPARPFHNRIVDEIATGSTAQAASEARAILEAQAQTFKRKQTLPEPVPAVAPGTGRLADLAARLESRMKRKGS